MLLTIGVFILTLLFLVLTHELGHFTAAKKFGVKVLEFGFGIPPKIWGKKWGETLVSVNLLPLGGFVRLLGEDEVEKKVLQDPRSFAAQPVWQRIIIVSAGVVMNIILASLIFWIILGFQGFQTDLPLITNYNFVGVNQTNQTTVVLGNIAPGSPAQTAGIQDNDRVVSVEGTPVNNANQLIEVTKQYAGKTMQMTLINTSNQTRTVTLTPRVNPPAGQGPMGVQVGEYTEAHLVYFTPLQKTFAGFTQSYNLAAYSLDIFGKLIAASIQTHSTQPVSESVSGPVGLTKYTGMVLSTQQPLIPYLNFLALLSLNLAIVNILPFPGLDGGRLFFLLFEAVSRRRVNAEVERWIHTVGFMLLLALFILITYSDIQKFFTH